MNTIFHDDRPAALLNIARGRASTFGTLVDDEYAKLQAEIAQFDADIEHDITTLNGGPPASEKRVILTGDELFDHPVTPARFLIRPILPRGRQGTIYGTPGLGKSFTARVITSSVTTGREAFGRYAMEASGIVLWITAEEDEDELRRGLQMVAEGAGHDLDALKSNLRVVPARGSGLSVADAQDRAWLEQLVAELRPVLIVGDSLASLLGCKLTDEEAIMPLLQWGAKLTTAHDATLLWTAHDRKPDRNNPAGKEEDLNELFGHRQVSAQLDFAFRFFRDGASGRGMWCTKMRGAPEPDDLHLELVVRPDELYSLRATEGGREAAEYAKIVESVRTCLLLNPGEVMSRLRDTVARHARLRSETVSPVLQELMHKGVIENRGTAHRFALHWVGPSMSDHVPSCPDTATVHHVPHVPPPLGGTRDMGHDLSAVDNDYDEWEAGRVSD